MSSATTSPPGAGSDILAVSVEDAARILHNTPDSIRRKLRAGRLQGTRDNAGKWETVYLPAGKTSGEDREDKQGGQADKSPGGRPRLVNTEAWQALIAEKDLRISDLHNQVENLQGQVAALSERLAYADRERLALLSRIPALEDHSPQEKRVFRWPWQKREG